MKFAAKELERNAKKCVKEEKTEKAKVKKVSNTSLILISPTGAVCCQRFLMYDFASSLGYPEGGYGSGQDPCGERHQTEEPVCELPENERSG